MAIAGVPLTCNQSCEILVPKDGAADGGFLYYLLNYGLSAFIRLSGGTTFSAITRRDIARVRFAVPPDGDEQAAISCILDAVDTALERTRAAVERARGVKNAVLQRFFYHAMGETAYANRPGKELPTGWCLIAMDDLLAEEPKNGVSPNASSQPPGIPTFSIAAIRDGRVDLETPDHLKYTRVPDATAQRFRIQRGDVLIVRGNANPDLVGKAGIVSRFPSGCIYPDIAKRVVFRADGELTVNPEFGVLAWNHAVVHNQVLRRAKTSNGTLKINTRDVKQIVVPVPTQQEQTDLVQVVGGVDAEIEALRAVEVAQQQLKCSLMHDLLTGRMRVQKQGRAAAA
jgi:type I restriction enzyme S subunit